MNKNQTSGEYLAPNVKVVEMRARQQILQGSDRSASGNTENYEEGTWSW